MNTAGRWIGASYVLGRDVLLGEPYPHICSFVVDGRMSSVRVRLRRKECAACLQEAYDSRPPPPAGLPPVTDEQRAEEARRMGERDLWLA